MVHNATGDKEMNPEKQQKNVINHKKQEAAASRGSLWDQKMGIFRSLIQNLYYFYMPFCVFVGLTGNTMVWILIRFVWSFQIKIIIIYWHSVYTFGSPGKLLVGTQDDVRGKF